MNNEALRQHLEYLVPEMRLILIHEPNPNSHGIYTPADIEKLIEPLKYCSEEYFVSFHLIQSSQLRLMRRIVSNGSV